MNTNVDSTRFTEQPVTTTSKTVSSNRQVMAAIVYDACDDSSVLHTATVPLPLRRKGEVLIRVEASSVNAIDYQLRRGQRRPPYAPSLRHLFGPRIPTYRIPGCDVAGRVVECDPESGVEPGDRVVALLDQLRGGACAEYTVCPIAAMTRIPSAISTELAAALPLAGTTALQALRDHGRIAAGKRVVINGASGGVGAFAIQIAKAYDCIVTAVASGSNESFCRDLGADEFCDYETQNFTYLGQQWDIIFDLVDTSCYIDTLDVLRPNGRYVSTDPNATDLLMTLASVPMSRSGSTMATKASADDLRELLGMHELGKLRVVVVRKFGFRELADAHRYVDETGARGKVLLINDLGCVTGS